MKQRGTKALAMLLSLVMVLSLVPGMSGTAYADSGSDYTFSIPSSLTVQNAGVNAAGNISVTALTANKKLTVNAASTNGWELKSGDNSVRYSMSKTSWEFTAEGSEAFSITVEDYSSKPAGTYTDTVTFTAKVEDAKPEYYDKLTSGAGSGMDQIMLLKNLGRGRTPYNSSLTAAQAYALATYQAAIDGKPVYVIMSSKDNGYEIHYALSSDAAATEHVSELYDLVDMDKSINMYYVAQ